MPEDTPEYQHNPASKESLPVDWATEFLIASFKHSQGGWDIQYNLFEFAHRRIPNTRISDDLRLQIENNAVPIIAKLLKPADQYGEANTFQTGHRYIATLDMLRENIQFTLQDWQQTFNGIAQSGTLVALHQATDAELVKTAAKAIVLREHEQLLKKYGRPNRRAPVGTTSAANSHWTDPYYSFLITHGFRHKATEDSIIDEWYKAIAQSIQNELRQPSGSQLPSSGNLPNWLVTFTSLVDIYNRTHSNSPFMLDNTDIR